MSHAGTLKKMIQITTYKAEATEHKGYRSLQQLVNPPFECCEIVLWWKAFISKEFQRALLIKLSPANRRINSDNASAQKSECF